MQADLFGGDAERQRLKIERRAADREIAETNKRRRRTAETSREAHAAAKRRGPTVRQKALAVMPLGPPGMTPDECATAIGEDKLSVRPEFTNLSAANMISQLMIDGVPQRRKNVSGKSAFVWVKRLP